MSSIRRRIREACERAGRDPGEVRLIGVTKTVSPDLVARAAVAGLADFGENHVSELETKRGAAPGATWHFIGRVQSNKARKVAGLADLVHTLEPGRAAERLAALGEERNRPVPCLVEVDFAGGRVGVAASDAETFVERCAERAGLEVRGLMTVAPLGEDPRGCFGELRRLRDRLRERFPAARELSMGMSSDMDVAVEEGATMVRVGSAIFGPRLEGGA